jgi:putative oxidoreductase
MGLVDSVRVRVMEALGRAQWLAPLIGRLAVGLVFMSTGWGKVHNLEKVTHFFQELGIPAASIQAPFVSYLELVGGTCVVLGLATRLFSVPLLFSMIVAILTAKRADLHGLFDLVGFDEFTYLSILAMLVILGPGKVSLDTLVARKLGWLPAPKAP